MLVELLLLQQDGCPFLLQINAALSTKLDCSNKERKQSSKQAIHDDHVAHVVPKGAALYSVAAATRDQRHGNLSWKNIIIIIIIFLV